MRVDAKRARAWGLAVGLAWVIAGAPASAQTGEGLPDDMRPPSELDRESADALAHAGAWLNEWRGDSSLLEAARIEIERVLKANPGSAEAHRRHGHYLLNRAMRTSRDYDAKGLAEAENALGRALALDARDTAAHLLLASVYRHQKRLEDARASLQRAEALGGDPEGLHWEWADLLMDEKKPEEALARCRLIEKAGRALRDSADRCMVDPLETLGRLDEVDRVHRAIIERAPNAAWERGNYAQFLLCSRRKPEAAAEEATRALALMDYPHARTTLAAALLSRWAELAGAGKQAEAEAAWKKAAAIADRPPAFVVARACHAGFARPVLKALRDARRGPVFSPVETVMYAAELAPAWLPGVFALEVQGTGRGRGRDSGQVYLNSETDYRDPRSITVRFTPEAAAGYRARHGVEPDAALRGKVVLVYGYARRQQIDFLRYGVPTGKYYYQTHVVVTDADQVAVVDPDEPAPSPQPVREAAGPDIEA